MNTELSTLVAAITALTAAVADMKTANKVEEVYTCPDYAHLIGRPVWIRTVTMTNCGILAAVQPNSFILTDAVWVANTGLWHKFVQEGVADEVEAMGNKPVVVGKYGLIDMGELPKIPQPK